MRDVSCSMHESSLLQNTIIYHIELNIWMQHFSNIELKKEEVEIKSILLGIQKLRNDNWFFYYGAACFCFRVFYTCLLTIHTTH